jgi:ribosomal protein L11 methyltransferase
VHTVHHLHAMRYRRHVYEASAGEVELLSAALAEAGTLGIEEQPSAGGAQRLVAYFADDPSAPVELPPGARLVESTVLDEDDWLAPYRATALPIAVGERFVIDPREPDPERSAAAQSDDVRTLLRIPARSAFGTGSHASTRLALRLLERLPLAGRSLLDVGAGSGVLALAALALGARSAIGLDVDLAAALLAGQHARLNALPAAFWAGGLAALDPAARFDVVVVNALPHEILPEAEGVARALDDGGMLVISGVLASEGPATLRAWSQHALAPVDELREEEWTAWALARS